MKVAIVIETFPKLSETFIMNQITALIDHKIDVKIFATRSADNEPLNNSFVKYNLNRHTVYESRDSGTLYKRVLNYFFAAGFLIIKRPSLFFNLFFFKNKFFNKEYLLAVIPFLNNEHFDIVHAHFGPIGKKVCSLQELGLLKSPIICSFHGYDVDREDFRNDLSYYQTLFARAEKITANSNFTLKNIQSLGCAPDKLVVLPESLRTEYFLPSRLGNATDHVRILTVARLVEFKGVEYSLRSMHELVKREIVNFHYTVIGTGELYDSLSQLIIQLGIEKYVSLIGAQSQENVLKEMNNSDIFLLTGVTAKDGRQENQGLVLQEAQAMKLPVIASDVGGIAEGVVNNMTGFLVKEKRSDLVAEKLIRLINDQSLRDEMGERGREYVVKHFDSETLTKKLLMIYDDILFNNSKDSKVS